MAGGQERVLRRRIRSVQSTKKITRAMELIAASRIVRAQQAIAAARPYVDKMAEVVANLADTPDAATHPLFRHAEAVRTGRDHRHHRRPRPGRGLQLLGPARRRAPHRRPRRRGHDTILVIVAAARRRLLPVPQPSRPSRSPACPTGPTYEDARRMVAAVMEPFTAGELDQIELVYTRFVSHGPPGGRHPAAGATRRAPGRQRRAHHFVDYEFEPEPAEILDASCPAGWRPRSGRHARRRPPRSTRPASGP